MLAMRQVLCFAWSVRDSSGDGAWRCLPFARPRDWLHLQLLLLLHLLLGPPLLLRLLFLQLLLLGSLLLLRRRLCPQSASRRAAAPLVGMR